MWPDDDPLSLSERAYWVCWRFLHRWFTYSEWRYRVRYRLWGFFQRGWRGWADHDVWGLDHYLAEVMAGALRRLESRRHGFPVDFYVDGGARLDDYTREETDAAGEAWGAWLRDKAAWCDWYARDEDGTSDDKGWIRSDLSGDEKSARIHAHMEKMRRFHQEVMPDLARRWGSLWD